MGFSPETAREGRGAVVVLGGRVGSAAVARRVATAARLALEPGERGVVVASGGCVWNGVVEADAMAEALLRAGVSSERIVRERCSLSTRDNARYAARVLFRRGLDEATIVTCSWHLPRAVALFRREGVRASGHGAECEPHASLAQRAWRWGRERVAMRLDGVG